MSPDCKLRTSFPSVPIIYVRPVPNASQCRRSVPEQEGRPWISSVRQRRGASIFSTYNPLYSLAGFLVGALIGMTGVGGGSLMTPLLVLLFGFHPATAVGTD